MARRDFQSNDYEWGLPSVATASPLLFDTATLMEALRQVKTFQRARPEPPRKTVTRKIKGPARGPNRL
jgi:hypothetical protein